MTILQTVPGASIFPPYEQSFGQFKYMMAFSRPTLNQYISRFPSHKLDDVCSEEYLLKLAETFSEWISVSTFLQLTKVQREDIERNWPHDSKRQRVEMFSKWKELKKGEATYRYIHVSMMMSRSSVYAGT